MQTKGRSAPNPLQPKYETKIVGKDRQEGSCDILFSQCNMPAQRNNLNSFSAWQL